MGELSRTANWSLAVVSTAVLLVSSTWFSGTAITPHLIQSWQLTPGEGAWLTISVQLGFICGTFLYAFLNLADIFNARWVFFVSALLGAAFNAAFAFLAQNIGMALAFRALTGITLAGIYPVGMKLVVSWFRSGLGWRLGVMVGALTMGTAFPYLMQVIGSEFDWRNLTGAASVLAIAGGCLVLIALSDGPYLKARAEFDPSMLWRVFEHLPFRRTAFGYFGHMWELYAFWSMVIFYLGARFQSNNPSQNAWLSFLVFLTIGIGSMGCILGGWVSQWIGEREVARFSLLVSGLLCLTSGVIYELDLWLITMLLLLWGFFVVSDSPQFSALATRYCPPEFTGTALTVQNGIGFAITVISIQVTPWMANITGWQWAFTFLAIGPLFGLYFVNQLPQSKTAH
ncbi:MFS transporter [Acidobacteria bacterium AH-259-L09]|nr:MFS transporter [Acidobacteria bacterium AH-259-L09]